MGLSDKVSIARRFQRSIKIDTDINSAEALDGFICPKSSAEVLEQLARHIKEVKQGAFTWTGPYGSGKSSLALILSALLCGNKRLSDIARKSLSVDTATAILDALPSNKSGWQIIPVVGRRANPCEVFSEVLADLDVAEKGDVLNEDKITSTLLEMANHGQKSGGVVVIIDEMGKFLESAAHQGTDVYLFQLLAEAASRSNSRLIIIGILHQSFHEYASRLSRDLRDEWSKIQGRFVDLAVNAAGEEQIELIAQAILYENKPASPSDLSVNIAKIIHQNRKGISKHLSQAFSWS